MGGIASPSHALLKLFHIALFHRMTEALLLLLLRTHCHLIWAASPAPTPVALPASLARELDSAELKVQKHASALASAWQWSLRAWLPGA